MAFEVMKEILEAEKRAEEILKQAAVEKETIKVEAMNKSNESQPKKDNILAEATKCCQEIKETAQTRLEQAADAVIRKVVG